MSVDLSDLPGEVVATSGEIAPEPGARKRRKLFTYRGFSYVLYPLIALALILGGWAITGHYSNPLLVSSPQASAKAISSILSSSTTLSAILLSVKEMYLGLAIGVFIGFVLGVCVGRFPGINNIASPFINTINATPLIVAIPLLIIWTGIGMQARVVFIVLVTIFPMLINTAAGVRNTNKGYIEVAATLGLSERATLWKISIPAAIPYMLAGLRSSLSLAIIGMVIGEMEISNVGIGWLLVQYGAGLKTDFLLGMICVTSVMGVVNVTIMRLMERTFFRWMTAAR